MKIKMLIINFLLTLLVFMTCFGTTKGLCPRIYVSGATYHNYANGYYYYYYSTCQGYTFWVREGDLYPILTYVSYNSLTDGWVIRESGCDNGDLLARHPNSAGYPEPFNLPGYWLEWNPYSMGFEPDTNLNIVCASYDDDGYLNGWEIFGIVIGSICGVVLIIALIAAICHCNKKKKLRNGNNDAHTQQQPAAVGVVSYNNAVNGITVTTISGQTADVGPYYASPYPPTGANRSYLAADPVYSTIPGSYVSPPVYDNKPPPSYTNVQNYPNSGPSHGNLYAPS